MFFCYIRVTTVLGWASVSLVVACTFRCAKPGHGCGGGQGDMFPPCFGGRGVGAGRIKKGIFPPPCFTRQDLLNQCLYKVKLFQLAHNSVKPGPRTWPHWLRFSIPHLCFYNLADTESQNF